MNFLLFNLLFCPMSIFARGNLYMYPSSMCTEGHILTLLHPQDQKPAAFAFDGTGLFEVTSVSRPESSTGSFLVGSHLSTTTEVQVLTAIDPVFVLAPYLEAISLRGSFVSQRELQTELVQLYLAELQPSLTHLLGSLPSLGDVLSRCCESKEVGEERYFRFSRTRYLAFLVLKHRELVKKVQEENIYFTEGSVEGVVLEILTSYAGEVHGADLSQIIGVSFIEYSKEVTKVVEEVADGPPAKKAKIVKAPKTAAPAGCQKISSFFTKK